VASKGIGNVVAGVAGSAVAAVTMYFFDTQLKRPEIFLDWAALVFSGLTTGIVTFFVVWGHFQEDPEPENPE